SGIAIAIGTMVDVGIILSENIIRHLDKNEENLPVNTVVYNATVEVSGAIITAVLTTIISFIPVFTLIGAEGKLFRPLAFTKTMALTASIIIALFLIPPLAAFLFKKRTYRQYIGYVINTFIALVGCVAIVYGYYLGIILLAFGITGILKIRGKISDSKANQVNIIVSAIAIVFFLAEYWRPLGAGENIFWNLIFVSLICFGLLGFFAFFRNYYTRILRWALANKLLFLSIPTVIVVCGFLIMKNTGKEFMPALNEGSFLLMPSSLPHAGVTKNKEVLQQLDMAVASIPEVETVVGKAGRIESALDPAPLSMYENVIIYKSEYILDEDGNRRQFKTNDEGLFELKNEQTITPGNKIKASELIEDEDGEFYRNWRKEIRSAD